MPRLSSRSIRYVNTPVQLARAWCVRAGAAAAGVCKFLGCNTTRLWHNRLAAAVLVFNWLVLCARPKGMVYSMR
jgi:hypothetical protein